MRKLSVVVNESLKSDVNDAKKVLKGLVRFKMNLHKLMEKDKDGLFLKENKNLMQLVDSAMESIEFSIVGAKTKINENVNIKSDINVLYKESITLLNDMNSVDDKNTTLSADFVDAIVDFGDAVDMLSDIKNSI